jgi:hypothetical protein
MQTNTAWWERCIHPDSHDIVRASFSDAVSHTSGVVKGVIMLPVLLPIYVLGAVVVNVMSIPIWLDHGLSMLYLLVFRKTFILNYE